MRRDKILVYGDGEQTRDFTYVEDVVEANILAAFSNECGEVFNVGGGSKLSINDLIKLIEKMTNHEAKIQYVEKQKGDVRDTLADTSKIKVKIGWKPKYKIEEGLRRQIEWIKSNFLL